MSNLQLFKDFVNERLAAAALDIFWLFEKTLAECQEELCRSKEKSEQLQRILEIQPEIKLHRTDVQLLSSPEPPQIKEEQELWAIQEGEQLQALQCDTTDSMFTSVRVNLLCDPEDSSDLPPLDQTPTVKNRGSLSNNSTEEQIKVESDDEDNGAPEPVSDFPCPSVMPECPTDQILEEERGGLLPERTACFLRLPPTRVMKFVIKSQRTKAKCSRPIPSPCPSIDTYLRISPCAWTRPITSPRPEREDISPEEAESKTVEKPYHCEECGKSFKHSNNLVTHRRIHTGEKPYKCEECGNAFRHMRYLVSHRRIHTAEKPHQCEECDMFFRNKGNLVVHRRIHTGEKPYQCKECDKAFRRKNQLANHIRIHTGEKPYQCEECDKAFREQAYLIKHRRIHTGEKPYHCEVCHKAFTNKCHLVNHSRIHTGEKPYHCQVCDKVFSRKSNLVIHRGLHTENS